MSSNRSKRSSTAAAAASTTARITRSQSTSTNNTTITLDTPPRRTLGNRVRNARRLRPLLHSTRQLADNVVGTFASWVEQLQPQNETDVQVVDLASPSATSERLQPENGQAIGALPGRPILQRFQATGPVEVDLTCDHDLDDEPVVLLEDIMAHRRYANNSPPIIIGSSPTRNRPHITQTGHATFQVHSMGNEGGQLPNTRDHNEVMDLSVNQRDEWLELRASQPASSEPQPSTSSASSTDAANEIQCPICLDGLAQMKRENRQLHSTMCGHLFCKSCIMQVINQTKQCPKCRQPLTLKKIHPIFI